jgi:hypothetical protein
VVLRFLSRGGAEQEEQVIVQVQSRSIGAGQVQLARRGADMHRRRGADIEVYKRWRCRGAEKMDEVELWC